MENSLIAIPVKYTITDLDGEVMATFDAFDDESFEITIDKQVFSPDELKNLADLLQKILDRG